jgi:hypothetical protein
MYPASPNIFILNARLFNKQINVKDAAKTADKETKKQDPDLGESQCLVKMKKGKAMS